MALLCTWGALKQGSGGGGGNWILATNFWADTGVWDDSAVWKD
jgi:hypothetical protein